MGNYRMKNNSHGRMAVFATKDLLAGEILTIERAMIYVSLADTRTPQILTLVRESYLDPKMWALFLKFDALSPEEQQKILELPCCYNSNQANQDTIVRSHLKQYGMPLERAELMCTVWRVCCQKVISGEKGEQHLFIGPTVVMSHSCFPNCNTIIRGGQCTIRVTRPVAEGEQLTLNYNDSYDFSPTCKRHAFFKSTVGFTCSCVRCNALGDDTRQFNCIDKECTGRHYVCQPVLNAVPRLLDCNICGARVSSTEQADMLQWERSQVQILQTLDKKVKAVVDVVAQTKGSDRAKAMGSALMSDTKYPDCHLLSMATTDLLLACNIDLVECVELIKQYVKPYELTAQYPNKHTIAAYLSTAQHFHRISIVAVNNIEQENSELSRTASDLAKNYCQKVLRMHSILCGRENDSGDYDRLMTEICEFSRRQVQDYHMDTCVWCGESPHTVAIKFSRCGRCRMVTYCSAKCQKVHWKFHKIACIPPLSDVCKKKGSKTHVFDMTGVDFSTRFWK